MTVCLQYLPMVRLGIEDRTFSVADDQRSLMRESICWSSFCPSASHRCCLLSYRSSSGLDRHATSSEEGTEKLRKPIAVNVVKVTSVKRTNKHLVLLHPTVSEAPAAHTHQHYGSALLSARWTSHEPWPHPLGSWDTWGRELLFRTQQDEIMANKHREDPAHSLWGQRPTEKTAETRGPSDSGWTALLAWAATKLQSQDIQTTPPSGWDPLPLSLNKISVGFFYLKGILCSRGVRKKINSVKYCDISLCDSQIDSNYGQNDFLFIEKKIQIWK